MTLALFSFVVACGSSESTGPANRNGVSEPDAESFLSNDASNGPGALGAHIEESHLAVSFVTLSCAYYCADVQAVATGGTPPYAFEWEDGSTNPSRHVCPGATTNYRVKVTDAGTSGEFARAPETAHASLTADVIACFDGGALREGGPDADAPATEGEGDAGPIASDAGGCVDPGDAPWTGCMTVTIGDSATTPSAWGGWCTPAGSNDVPYSWAVCLPHSLLAGHAYGVKITYEVKNLVGPVPQSGVFGSSGACNQGESIVPLQGWPIGSPYTGTFLQSACVTGGARYPHLLYQEVQQSLSGYMGQTTFEICNGCANEP